MRFSVCVFVYVRTCLCIDAYVMDYDLTTNLSSI